MTVRVLGLPVALARMAQVVVAGEAAAESAKTDLVTFVAETERALVAVDTGETLESIEETPDGVQVSGAAIYLEFGTSKMSAQPFVRPAADSAAGHDLVPIARATLLGGL